jgi:molybdenum cofactor cytidylyltransferase
MNLAVVILAAGASSRMGRPKLLLPWNGTSVIGQLVGQWNKLTPAQLGVVSAAGHQALREELLRIGIAESQLICNPSPERGMFSSVQCAARWDGWTPQITHWAIALGDQPLVRAETLSHLLQLTAETEGDIHQPSRNGRGRHPVIFSRKVFERLAQSSAENLKQFITTSGMRVQRCEMDDPGLDLDLDEPADYERALAAAKLQ